MDLQNEKLKKWVASFSGCDGGNPQAEIWISGIEWGGGSREPNYYKSGLKNEIAAGAVKCKGEYPWKELNYGSENQFGRGVSKLYSAIQGHSVSDYRKVTDDLKGDEIFKLNLYPIAFDRTDEKLWSKNGLDRTLGFSEKYLFATFCWFHRFPFFAKQVKKHRPKLIIGVGTTYLRDFLLFFGGLETPTTDIATIHIGSGKSMRRLYWSKLSTGSALVVVPFFTGSYGLNSDDLKQKAGESIRELISR